MLQSSMLYLTSSSVSFFFCISSIIVTRWSVIFWTSSRPRRSSACEIFDSFSSFFSLSFASRRTRRTPLRASSANLWTILESSLRRSSVRAGIGMRMTLPSFVGFSPRLAEGIPFSTFPMWDGSNGCGMIIAGSGTDRDATWFSGTIEPYASTCTVSRMVTDARPVRTPPSSRRTCSMCPSMRFFTSANRPFRSVTSIRSSLGRNGRAHRLAHDDAAQVPRRPQVEHHDRQLVVHAQGNGRGVHHLQPLGEHLQIGNVVVFGRGGVEHRIGGVDAVDLGALQDDIRLHLHGAERGCRVGREIGVAGAGGEDDDAPFLQVADSPAADERLGHGPHLDGAGDARVDAAVLHSFLHPQSVADPCHHAHVVGGPAIHPRRGS